MCKSAQNNPSNNSPGGPDAALECKLHGGLNVALEDAAQSSLERAIEDPQKAWKKNAFDVARDENATVGTFEGTPKGVLQDLYKDPQKGAFEVEIKDALEVTTELYLKMPWWCFGSAQECTT